jgi:preprotein translocase subunit SecA
VSALTRNQRLCDIPEPRNITKGLDAIADGLIGASRRRRGVLASLRMDAERVDELGRTFRRLGDTHLRSRLDEYRRAFRINAMGCKAHVLNALAAVREAAERSTGLRPFPVQIMGSLALYRGYLAEMATGEGKTLTAGLAAVLAGWTGRPCHVVTVNDYLARRDAEWLQPLYGFCGLTAACVTGQMPPAERARGHVADVTYTTSKEILADFLRDRLSLGKKQSAAGRIIQAIWRPDNTAGLGAVMRGLHTAIVDEADSVLIDEAVTPLIISGPTGDESADEAYEAAWSVATRLKQGVDYRVNARYRDLAILPAGYAKIETLGIEFHGFWRTARRQIELIQQALTAREYFHKGKQYVVEDGKVVIVDEFTGRLMPMCKWRHGLHQVIEAREGVELSPPDETLARLSFQRFFRLFRKLSGMSGTAREAAAEFWHIYRLPVITIPANRPCQRRELRDRVFPDQQSKWNAVVGEIARLHATGRPLLIGTRSIDFSEMLAGHLRERGLVFSLLNATRHREEAEIIAGAGQCGRITLATNMAGRGTDIALGPGVAEQGGLHVLATERHESRRIDRQLYGRAGRQGDPGSAQAFVSADDELLRRFSPQLLRWSLKRAVESRGVGAHRLATGIFALAQHTAQKQAFHQRRQVLAVDTWLAQALSFGGAADG